MQYEQIAAAAAAHNAMADTPATISFRRQRRNSRTHIVIEEQMSPCHVSYFARVVDMDNTDVQMIEPGGAGQHEPKGLSLT